MFLGGSLHERESKKCRTCPGETGTDGSSARRGNRKLTAAEIADQFSFAASGRGSFLLRGGRRGRRGAWALRARACSSRFPIERSPAREAFRRQGQWRRLSGRRSSRAASSGGG